MEGVVEFSIDSVLFPAGDTSGVKPRSLTAPAQSFFQNALKEPGGITMVDRQPAKTFEDLIVWQKAHAFVLEIYRASASFPKSELYGLVSQIRRAAVSAPANIAEGFKRQSKREKIRFLNIAQASLEEVRYYLILSRDLSYLDSRKLQDPLEEISRMLEAYTRSIRQSKRPNS